MKRIDRCNEILKEIALTKKRLQSLTEDYEKALSELRDKFYPQIEALKEELRKKESELEKLAREHRAELFVKCDRVELPSGALLLKVKEYVKRARGVLDALERLGWDEAIKVKKSVDWDVLEKWPEERLIAIGTERIRKETIEYELNESLRD